MTVADLSATVRAGSGLSVPANSYIHKPCPLTGFTMLDIPAPVFAGYGYYLTIYTSHNYPKIFRILLNNIKCK